MTVWSISRIAGAAGAALIITALGVSVAGAAPGTPTRGAQPRVDEVTVSNPSPMRESTIDVHSAGWRPGGTVAISLSGIELRRARADERGLVNARISIPANAIPGFDVLTVTGTSADGIPQQIVSGVSVVVDHPAPRSARPWIAISLLLAAATLLLLVCQRVESRPARPTRLAG